MLPKHQNPTNVQLTASAPYNFVPLPERVVTIVSRDELKSEIEASENLKERDQRLTALLAKRLPNHDSYDSRRKTGYFQVTLTTEAPLFIRAPLTLAEFAKLQEQEEWERKYPDEPIPFRDKIKNKTDFFYTKEEKKASSITIPGSSLRGMLRSVFEIVTYSKVSNVADSPKIFYRAVASLDAELRKTYSKRVRKAQVGYLLKENSGWYVVPAKTPQEMGWHTEKPFLEIKDARFGPEGDLELPGLARFNARGYKSQVLDVRFNVEERTNADGDKFSMVTALSLNDEMCCPYKGVLLCSGNMLETQDESESADANDGERAASPRTKYVLALEAKANPQKHKIKINAQSVQDYLDTLTPFQKKPPRFDPQMGCLVQNAPVFYTVEDGASEVHFFGHSPNFRIPARATNLNRAVTPLDFVPEELRRPEEVDFTEAVFGFTKSVHDLQETPVAGSRNIPPLYAYAGRVFVTDAVALDQNMRAREIIIPKILASPKPTTFQHYLTQEAPDTKLDHYDTARDKTVLRGTKRYWHQGSPRPGEIKPEPDSPQVDEQGNVDPSSTLHTQLQPVLPKKHFRFRVYFENLSDVELGALAWVLVPQGEANKKYLHSLGMGNPLGMGAVELDAALHLTSRQVRYKTLFDNEQWQNGESKVELMPFVQAFESMMLRALPTSVPCNHLVDLERIAMLLRIMEYPGYKPEYPARLDNRYLVRENRPNTRYMTIKLNNVPNTQQNEYKEYPVLPDPRAFGEWSDKSKPFEVGDEFEGMVEEVENAEITVLVDGYEPTQLYAIIARDAYPFWQPREMDRVRCKIKEILKGNWDNVVFECEYIAP